MYSDDEEEEKEEQSSENFFVSFYRNNKVLVWVLLGVLAFVIIMSLLTKGGSKNEEKIEYSISIYPEGDIFVEIGKSTNILASVKNDPNAEIIWTIGDEDIAIIDHQNIKGLDYGETTVTAKYLDSNNKEYTDSRKVVVGDGDPNVPLTDVSFKEGDLFMPLNETYTIALSPYPSNGYISSEKFVSSDPNVVTVDNKGNVRSVGEGEATITVNVNDGKFEKKLKVYVDSSFERKEIIVTPEKITFDGQLRKIKVGTTETLTYTVKPTNTDKTKLIWESSNDAVVTVDNGRITGISEGTAKITLSSVNGERAIIDVEVESDIVQVTEVNLTATELYLTKGESQVITPRVLPDNASNKALSYTSLDTSVAYVIPNSTGTQATVTGLSAGYATIVVKSTNNIEALLTVLVSDPNGGNSGGNGGGSSGGSGGSSTSAQGFKISSSDYNGEPFINSSYDKTKPKDNGAVAPVRVTVEKTDSSVDKLVIKVCNYPASDSCGEKGYYETNDTKVFDITEVGEYVIRVEEYNSNGKKTRTTNKYMWVKETSGGSGSSTSSVSISCTKTNIVLGESTTCTAKIPVGDSIKSWKRDGVVTSLTSQVVRITPTSTGAVVYSVETTKGEIGSVKIVVTSSGSSGSTVTPAPTAKPTPTASANVTQPVITIAPIQNAGSDKAFTESANMSGTFTNTIRKDGVSTKCIKFTKDSYGEPYTYTYGQAAQVIPIVRVSDESCIGYVDVKFVGENGITVTKEVKISIAKNGTSYTNVGNCSDGKSLKAYESCTVPNGKQCRVKGTSVYVSGTLKTTTNGTVECIDDPNATIDMSTLRYECYGSTLEIYDGSKQLNTDKYCTKTTAGRGNINMLYRYYCTPSGDSRYTGSKTITCGQ